MISPLRTAAEMSNTESMIHAAYIQSLADQLVRIADSMIDDRKTIWTQEGALVGLTLEDAHMIRAALLNWQLDKLNESELRAREPLHDPEIDDLINRLSRRCGFCEGQIADEDGDEGDPLTCEAEICARVFCDEECADQHMGKHEDAGEVERDRDGIVTAVNAAPILSVNDGRCTDCGAPPDSKHLETCGALREAREKQRKCYPHGLAGCLDCASLVQDVFST